MSLKKHMNKPNNKPKNPNFSSGPTSKRPGWDISVLSNALTGRSHRSVECKARLKEAIDKSKDIMHAVSIGANGIITNKPKVVYDILKDIGKR